RPAAARLVAEWRAVAGPVCADRPGQAGAALAVRILDPEGVAVAPDRHHPARGGLHHEVAGAIGEREVAVAGDADRGGVYAAVRAADQDADLDLRAVGVDSARPEQHRRCCEGERPARCSEQEASASESRLREHAALYLRGGL